MYSADPFSSPVAGRVPVGRRIVVVGATGATPPIVVVTPGTIVVVVVAVGAVVVVAQPGAIVMVWGCVAVKAGALESATCTVKLNVPAAVGVPVIAPVAGAITRPGGRVPAVTDQVNGAVPPSTLKMFAE